MLILSFEILLFSIITLYFFFIKNIFILVLFFFMSCIYFYKYKINSNNLKINISSDHFFIIFPLLFLSFIYYITPLDYLYTSQDAFAWWGQSIKWMIENEKIWDEFSPLTQKYNVPGPQLYQYIFLKFFGFSELNTLLAVNFLIFFIFSLCLYLLKINFFDYLILYPLILSVPPLFGYHYADIMIDGLLSAFITLYMIIFLKLIIYNKYYKFFCLVSCSIVLVKTIGIIIAIIFCLSLVIKRFIDMRKKKGTPFSFLFSILPLIFSFLMYLSWNNYLFNISANRDPIIDISYLLTDNSITKFFNIINGFINWLTESNFLLIKIHEFSFISTHFIFNVLTIFIFFKFFTLNNVVKLMICINGFIFVFLFIFLILYQFYFVNYEASTVASLSRYIGVFYIPWAICLIILYYKIFLKKIIENTSTSFIMLSLCLSLSAFIIYNSQNYFLSLGLDQQKIKNFKSLKDKLMSNNIPKSKKVYIISQNTAGHVTNGFEYLLGKYSSRQKCWSFKNKLKKDDLWDCSESIYFNLDLFELHLSKFNTYLLRFMDGYKYLYIDEVDKDFIKSYGGLFIELKNNALYKIDFLNKKFVPVIF